MATQFKTEEESKLVKQSKTKLEKAHKVFFILSIIAEIILFIFFIVCFFRPLLILPLVIFWLFVVLFPSVFTIGIVWVSEGYRNFVNHLNELIGQSGEALNKAAAFLIKGLPYIASFFLIIILTYCILSFVTYKKNVENKKYRNHFIAGIVLFVLGSIFIIVSFIIFANNN